VYCASSRATAFSPSACEASGGDRGDACRAGRDARSCASSRATAFPPSACGVRGGDGGGPTARRARRDAQCHLYSNSFVLFAPPRAQLNGERFEKNRWLCLEQGVGLGVRGAFFGKIIDRAPSRATAESSRRAAFRGAVPACLYILHILER